MDEQKIQLIVTTVWAVLLVVAKWLLFRKAGRPGWLSIIPVVNIFTEFSICWTGWKCFLQIVLFGVGIYCGSVGQEDPIMLGIAAVAILWAVIIHWRESMKLAASFGKGFLYGLFLVFFSQIGRVVLGLGSAEYIGRC